MTEDEEDAADIAAVNAVIARRDPSRPRRTLAEVRAAVNANRTGA